MLLVAGNGGSQAGSACSVQACGPVLHAHLWLPGLGRLSHGSLCCQVHHLPRASPEDGHVLMCAGSGLALPRLALPCLASCDCSGLHGLSHAASIHASTAMETSALPWQCQDTPQICHWPLHCLYCLAEKGVAHHAPIDQHCNFLVPLQATMHSLRLPSRAKSSG